MTHATYDFAVGLFTALALHAGAVWWGASVERAAPDEPEQRVVAKAVNKEIALPKPAPPAPPPPPPPPPPPVDKPKPVKVKPKRTNRGQPKPKTKPKQDKPPPDEPPPLVLSQTYGDTGGSVAVQAGDDDIFGDPSVAANERNTRPRVPDAKDEDGTDEEDSPPEREIVITHARPLQECKVKWPVGAPIGRRVVEVRLMLTIGVTGKVTKTRVLRSAGEPFDSAARKAIGACRFSAGKRDGKRFVDRVSYVVEFLPGADA